MNYIYDILLNFKKDFLEFYEWDLNDEIVHVRKIPLFRVKKTELYDFKNCVLKIDPLFLKSIFNRTEIFKGRNKKTIKYCFLIGSIDDVVAIYLDESGKIIYKSDLLIDEAEEILEVINQIDETNISYQKICDSVFDFKTRKEKEKIDYILKHLNKTTDDKLKYLYYECFDIKEDNIEKIKNNLLNRVNNDFNIVNKIYEFYKLLSYKTR